MANGNFVVQNGLQVGPLTIDAATGAITTTGNITTTGTTTTFINEIVTGTEAVYGLLTANSGAASTSTTTGAFQVVGGVGISGAIYNGGVHISSGNIVAASGTTSTSTTTGALVVVGGTGISGNLSLGANILLSGSPGTSGQFLSTTGTGLQWVTLSASSISNGTSNVTIGSSGGIATVGIGSANVMAVSSTGTQQNGTFGVTGNVYIAASILPTGNVSSNLGDSTHWFNTFFGVATQAKYADLAENYQADAAYQAGQVLEFGGIYEVTLASPDTKRVAGVVSTNPAHLMNGGLQGSNVIPLALQGRVPCNVIGPVTKGDLMVSAGFGYAKPNNNAQVGQVIGKALADFSGAKGVIEVVIGRQ
jgi:hypothetical protein